MTETLRAFVAIDLPSDVRGSLSALAERIARAGTSGVRQVRPEAMHLTLRFLGALPAGEVDSVLAALADTVRGHRPFSLRLGEVGTFPARGTPRVLWVGLDGDLDALRLLRSNVDDALATRLDFEREERPFSPHLTLARVRPSAARSDVERALSVLESAEVDVGLPVPVSSVGLLRSVLRPGGAVYLRLGTFSLGVESRRDDCPKLL